MGPFTAVLAWLVAVAGLGIGTPIGAGPDVTAAALPPPAVVGGGHPATERSVSIVGDSILLGAVSEVRSTLTASGWDPTIATFPGLPLSVGAQVLAEQQAAGQLGDIVVIHLGNNLPTSVAGFVHDLDATMAMLADVPFVVWMTIQTFEPSRIQVDAELQAATQRWPNLQLLDWNAAVDVHPDWTGGSNPHLSVAGRIGMAHLIDDRLDQIRHSGAKCRSGTNPPSTATSGHRPGRLAARRDRAGPRARRRAQLRRPVQRGCARAARRPCRSTPPRRAPGTGSPRPTARSSRSATPRTRAASRVGGSTHPCGRSSRPPAARPATGSSAATGACSRSAARRFRGSMGGQRLNAPVVGMAPTPSGGGYWLVAADGGVFSFGDAVFLGSAGAVPLNAAVVSAAARPSGDGYWLYASDGGVFAYGAAAFAGSLPGEGFCFTPQAVQLRVSPSGGGYWVATARDGVFAYGDAPALGDPSPPVTEDAPVVSLAVRV